MQPRAPFLNCRYSLTSVCPTILPFSGGRERERSDRPARPTATAGWAAQTAYRATTDCFGPRAPHDWHATPVGPAHTAAAPHFLQCPSSRGCAAQAAHFLFRRVFVVVFGRGTRQTGQCFPPRLSLDPALRRFCGTCRGDSASTSFSRLPNDLPFSGERRTDAATVPRPRGGAGAARAVAASENGRADSAGVRPTATAC